MHNGYTRRKFRYERPGEGLEDDPYLQADLTLQGRIIEVIERHYPGHPWLIEVSHAQGVAMLSMPVLMGDNKMVMHISALKSDPSMRIPLRYAGEILERYKISRGKFDGAQFVDAVNSVPPWRRARNGYVPA